MNKRRCTHCGRYFEKIDNNKCDECTKQFVTVFASINKKKDNALKSVKGKS